MNALTQLGFTSAPLLKAIQAGSFAGMADLAEKAGRNKANTSRDLRILEEAGLVVRPDPHRPELTAAGLEQLAAVDRANAPDVLHHQIERDPLNPRRVFHPEPLQALAESIWDDGKLTVVQPLVIRPRADEAFPFRLVAGERRHRAIEILIRDGRWPADKPVPVSIRVLSDEEAAVIALVENMQREDLSAVDEALTFEHLATTLGWTNADIAKHIKRVPEYVQQRRRVLGLPAEVQERMRLPKTDENRIGFKEARRMFTVSKEPARPKAPELSPKLALALLELAHKIEAAPMTLNGEVGFTVLSQRPTGGALATLHERKILNLREWGGQVFAKIQLYTSGAVTWLEDAGFYGPNRDEVIWQARTAIMSPHRASEATRGGRFITPELNTEVVADAAATNEPDYERPNNRGTAVPVAPQDKPFVSSTDKINARMKAEQEARDGAHKASMEALCAGMSDGIEGILPHAATAVERYAEAQLAGNEDLAAKAAELMDACVWKLNGDTLFASESGDEAAGPTIRKYFRTADGDAPTWGYEGRFVLSVDGMVAGVEVKRGLHADLDFHITDLDMPFFSNTGYRSSFLGLARSLKTKDGAPLVVEIARDMRKHVAEHSSKRKPEPIDREWAGRHLARVAWVAEVIAAGKTIDGSALIEAHEAAVQARQDGAETNPVRPIESPAAPALDSIRSETRHAAGRISQAVGLEIGLLPSWRPSQNFAWRLADDAFRSVYRGDVARFTAQFARLVAAVGEKQAASELGRVFRRFGIDHKTLAMTLDADSPNYEATHRDCYGVGEPDPNDPNKSNWDDEDDAEGGE